MFSVLVIRLRSLRLLRVSGIVMRLRMFLLLITFLKASHSFRNRLLVICKNAYLFATMIMTSVSSPFSCCSGIVRLNLIDRKSGSAGMPRPSSYAVFCLKKKRDWNGIHYKQGMSRKNVGTTSLSANIATIPPGGVAYD